MNNLIERMIADDASKEDINCAIYNIKLIKNATQKLEEFDSKYSFFNHKATIHYKKHVNEFEFKKDNKIEISFESSEDAFNIIDDLCKIIDAFGRASVADAYVLASINSDFTQNKYGWSTLIGTEIIYSENGSFKIRFPKPEKFN